MSNDERITMTMAEVGTGEAHRAAEEHGSVRIVDDDGKTIGVLCIPKDTLDDDAWTSDAPIPEDAAIAAAHPILTGRHDLYTEALRMVGAKHSKYALVDLVNWLLVRAERAERISSAARALLTATDEWHAGRGPAPSMGALREALEESNGQG